MSSWRDEADVLATRPRARSVTEALSLPVENECPGNGGLCGLPLVEGEHLCPNCNDTSLVYRWHGPSEKLQSQVQPPSTPECATCRRPVQQAGDLCRWCLGQPVVTASPRLQESIDARFSPECPGNGGLCGVPLGSGETRCTQCRQQNVAPSPAPAWERCRGRNGGCGRLVLPGRGLCFGCRQETGTSRLVPFSIDGSSPPVFPAGGSVSSHLS